MPDPGQARQQPGRAIQEITRLVRRKVATIVIDGNLGCEFACRVVEEMIRLADLRHQAFLSVLQALPARENGSRKSLNTFGRELTEAESRLTFRERSVKEALQKVGEALKQLREEAEYRQMFEAFHQEDELPSEVRVLLIERQIALGLQPERAANDFGLRGAAAGFGL